MPSVPAYPNDIPQLLAHSALNGLSTDDLGMSLEKYRQQTIDHTQLFQSSCGDFALEILDPIPFFGVQKIAASYRRMVTCCTAIITTFRFDGQEH